MCFLLVLHHCLQSRPPIRSIVRGDEIWYHLTKSLNVSSNNPCPHIRNNAYPEVIAHLSEHWKAHHQLDISILGQQTCGFSLPILSIFLEKQCECNEIFSNFIRRQKLVCKNNEFTYSYSLQMGNASGYSTLFIHALFVYQHAQNELTLRFVFDGIWLET